MACNPNGLNPTELGLGDDIVIAVSELACREENCPDIETVIGVMRSGQPVETAKTHKPVSEIVQAEIALVELSSATGVG